MDLKYYISIKFDNKLKNDIYLKNCKAFKFANFINKKLELFNFLIIFKDIKNFELSLRSDLFVELSFAQDHETQVSIYLRFIQMLI